MAAPSSSPAADTATQFDYDFSEDLLKLTDDITLSDLLLYPGVSDFTIRFICGVRKLMTQVPPPNDPDLIKTETLVTRAYFGLGPELRDRAFSSSPYRQGEGAAPSPVTQRPQTPSPQDTRPTAPPLDEASATTLVTIILSDWLQQSPPKQTFVPEQLRLEFERRYTDNSKLRFNAIDTSPVRTGPVVDRKRWEQLIFDAIDQLENTDIITRRHTKGDYFIFDN